MKLGSYRLLEQLGRGGMGEVWRAEPLVGGAPVAIKCLDADDTGALELERRLLEEARVLASFNHPNLVRVVDVGVEDLRAFMVMELLHGRSLSDLLRAGAAPLPVGLVVEFAIQMMSGLEAIHGARDARGLACPVIHRDIKPSNLFVTLEGTLKIIDFGIAMLPLSDRTRTQTGQIRGSLPYCSPEQARGQPLGPQSDLFSAGLVLHELLTGQRVLAHANEAALVTSLLWDPIAPVHQKRPDVPAALAQIIARALVKEPAQRTPSAAAMAAALSGLEGVERWSRADVAAWLAQVPPAKPSVPSRRAAPLTDSGDAHAPRTSTPMPMHGKPATAGDREAPAELSPATGPAAMEQRRRRLRAYVLAMALLAATAVGLLWRSMLSRSEPGAASQSAQPLPLAEGGELGAQAATASAMGGARAGEVVPATASATGGGPAGEVVPATASAVRGAPAGEVVPATASATGGAPAGEVVVAIDAGSGAASPGPALAGATNNSPTTARAPTPVARAAASETGAGRKPLLAKHGPTPTSPSPPRPARKSPSAPSAAKATAWLTVDAKPFYGRVLVDGVEIGITPLYRRKVAAGRHVLEVVREDGRSRRQSLELGADQERSVLVRW